MCDAYLWSLFIALPKIQSPRAVGAMESDTVCGIFSCQGVSGKCFLTGSGESFSSTSLLMGVGG